ncbi:coat protein [uncultured Caudovirales phage]|uniref:Coat protein n=1 Tax=uncultured Caudovirales phage TaxID=2100421 RepID=A0A6J5PHD5_9CAUD|nr:coat protein [uncultured Caudovirales phage]
MPNGFNKEERVAFENVLEGFNDALVLSKNISNFTTDQTTMERTNDVIWRPQPYIGVSIDAPAGTDISASFKDQTQLAVPATIGFNRAVPLTLNAKELRDALQENRLGDAAKQKLASDINTSIMNVAAAQGTMFVKRSSAATGFDDVAQCEAIFNEQGVPSYDRYLALSTRDYNGMAGNLAGRQTMNTKPTNAYERAFVGQVASFDTFKLDYANRQLAAAGGAGLTVSTLDAAVNYYLPKATSTTVGGKINVDNRYQTITVSSTTNVAAGDAFTIAGVNAVHHITRGDTGQLKTFRVISVTNSTTMVISPPIISNQVANDAAAQYQNCVVNTKSATSAIVFLNTTAGFINPFWQKDAFELLPGRYAVPSDAGVAVMRASTDQGIEIVMQKFYDINTMKTKFRWDCLWGVVCKQPEMAGVMMFSQS